MICAIGLPLVLHVDANAADPMAVLQPPSPGHIFGTDDFGRDILVRVLIGSRLSLLLGFAVSIVTFLIGMPLGMLAAYARWADTLIMRVVDALMSLPAILLALAFMAVVGPGLTNVLIVLTVAWTPLTIRMARASVLEVLSQGYIEAAQALGVGMPTIFARHVLRNAVDPVLVQQMVAFTGAILGEATFSFVGAGLQPPDTSLGMMLSEAQQNIYQAPWLALFPAAALVLLVLSIMLLGDGLRDLLAVGRT
ncbi:MAG TPA: ABC transporter permease [Chloroflexota bacterium]|nr:ABC transporter permease [Chloroflexota bacterium]